HRRSSVCPRLRTHLKSASSGTGTLTTGAWKAGTPIRVWSWSVPNTETNILSFISGESPAMRTPWALSQVVTKSFTKASLPAWTATSSATGCEPILLRSISARARAGGGADVAPFDLGEGALERADQQLLGAAGRGGGRGAARHGAAGQREPQQRRDR